MSGKRFIQTDIAKGIGIILVVIGHSFPDSTKLAAGSFVYFLYKMIYSFHMPLFFFVSGLVSAGIVKKIGANEKLREIKKKAMRLLVPYFVFGAIFIPLRVVFAEFARFSYDFTKLYTVFLGNNPCGQLWFLYVLFLFSLIAILFATEKNITWLLIPAAIVTLVSPYATLYYDGISWYNSLFMCFFYFAGLNISRYHDRLYKHMDPRLLFVSVPAFAGAFALFMLSGEFYMLKILTASTGIVTVLCLSELISRIKTSLISDALQECGKYSMDIYIIHSPAGVCLRILLLRLAGIDGTLYSAIYIAVGVIGAYLVSRFIIRRIPVFRLLFLGMYTPKEKTVKPAD